MSEKNKENLLSFDGSENFRKFLVEKNLKPYQNIEGYSSPEFGGFFEYKLSTFTPKDQKNITETNRELTRRATITNEYNQINKIDGGEILGGNAGAVSLQQKGPSGEQELFFEKTSEYSLTSSKLELINEFFIDAASIVNRYTPPGGFIDTYISTDNINPKFASLGREYPNFENLEKNIESIAQTKGFINVYTPLDGFFGPIKLNTNLPKTNFPSAKEYPNFSYLNENNWIKYQTAIASINQYIPENGYVSQIVLQTNVKNKSSVNEYRNSIVEDKELIENIKKEITINRYQPTNGLFNIYSNQVFSLSKIFGKPKEYNSATSSIIEFNKQNQVNAASINKFIPENGYTDTVFLTLNTLTKESLNVGGYYYSTITDEEILKNVRERFTINKYQPQNGDYNFYTYNLLVPSKDNKTSSEYKTPTGLLLEINKNTRTAAAATNKFRPAYGYNNEISIITNPISNTSQNNGEYYFVNEDDKTNIEKAKKEILNNRYQPSNGFFNFFTNSYTTLSKLYGYPQEYNAQLNSVLKIYKEEQLRLASINKFKPEQGYNNIVNLELNVLNTQSQVYTEYSSTVNTDESILSKTKENISVNRYQADGGVYNLYGSTLFTLTKLYNSGQEYKTNNNVLDNINRDIKTQLSSINKFSPTDGFVNEFFFRLSTLQKNQNGIKEYEKSTITENEIIKNTQKEISINKYQPSSNFYNLYTTKLFTLKNSDTVSSEYDGPIFEYSELERQSRDFASGLNKFSPLEGYTYEVSLETNSIAKGKNKLGEYSNSTQNEQDLLKNTKEEIALNRYQPLGLYNLYSNSLNALSKLKSGAQEYNQNSNSVVEVNSENRAFSSTMNKYGPQFGYITEVIINTSSLEKDTIGLAEYPSLLTPDTDLLIKTQTETAVNRYGVNNGQLDVYTQKTSILPKARSSSQEYVNSDLFYSNTSKISQNEAATKNKYKPYGGYNYEIQLEINNSNSYGNQVNEYFNSTKTDSEIIEIVKEEISINRYQPIGLYNVYSNNLVSLEKIGSDSKEYTIGVNPIEQSYKKIQLDAAAANRYSPDGGYVSLIQIDSTSLVKNDSETSEYPNNVENDEILIQNTLDEISLNRYTATNGQILIYSQNIKILPKIGGSSDQYINSDIFISPTTKIFQTEAAAINKYIPDGGYKYEADLRVIPLQSNIQFKGEYNSEIASSFNNFEDTTEAVLINKYRPNGGLLNVYSNSLVTPLITNNTPQEYSTESDFIFKLNKVSRTIASTSNRYSPNLGYSESVTINSINLTKIEGFNNEYPDNISESQDLLERTKTELAINRYSATGGDLGIYSQNLTILPKVGSGSQEYINSDLFLILSSNKLRTDAAKINKWIPEEGYNSEYILSINSLEKNKIQTPYPLNGTDQLEIKNNIEQEFAATYNKFIPDDGYNQQYSNVSVILPKGNENIYGISNEEELFPNIPPLTTKQEILNRYTPDYGFDFLYSPTIHILEKNPQLTKEYPNFLIPDDTLFDTAIVDINALLNGNTNILINPQESYLQQISVRFLAESFRDRIQREIERQTIGRVNLQAFSDPFSLSLLVSGQEPLIYKNFTITVPDGVFDQAAYLIQRFSGTYIPVSPIEGEYFTTYPEKEKTQVGQVIDDFLSFFTKPTTPTNRSIKFLNNTGAGQKSVLFTSLEYNVYRPKYDKNLTQIGTLIDNFLDFTNNPLGLGNNSIGNLYIPYDSEDIQNLSVQTGLDELGKTFEGPEIDNRNFGLKSLPYNEDTDPSGGFAWTQSSSIDLAGKFLGTDGLQGPQSPDYQGNTQIKLNSSRSDTLSFRERSILKRTQEIVDNAPTTGVKRYSSAGNAINQISKVFHDGYKEMTKGSRVKKYVQKNGKEEGVEYGRTFTKDIPYLNYNNLQTTIANNSGLETNGNIRKFTNSILDSTYNLNIAPTFGQDSTNIKDNRVKKYMFSIENLAWRGTDEFNNLPDCEKGPNGGRIMWFPPYGLDVGTETSSPTFNATNFLGRPEPIYTYENTKRSGSVSWQILVDHPSVTDIVVKYELEKEDGNIATQVINSFFSGLKKYDIYELAKKYGTMSLTTLESVYQNALQSNQVSDEDKQLVLLEIGPNSNNLATSNSPTDLSGNFVNTNFYFPVTFNSTLDEYSLIYDDYTALKSSYISLNFISPPSVETFFDTYLTQNYESLTNLRQAVGEILQGGKEKVEIVVQKVKTLGTVENDTLWYGAIENFFGEYILENSKRISEYLNKSLILKEEVGELGIVTPKSESGLGGEINCNTQSIGEPNLNYSFWAAACRGYIVKRIIVTPNENAEIDSEQNQNSNPIPQSQFGLNPQQTTNVLRNATSVTKKVIRELLTEMNYFEVLKKDQSFIYDSIKTKFKFFNPAFHSMTPEGLNSRLVFLQQCVRPGRTIPVRQEDGSSVTTDSYNTNFGTPPILVLRIGDFFHTKIVPTQLSITYEPLWDYNPEGIGFQPMIAKVTLGYDMIGGQGLEGPVEQLQNALSFNYYANTEMYDERATPTEDLTVVTNEILQQLSAQQPAPVQNNAGPQETDLGNTFGNVVTTTQLSNGGQIGDIKYKSFFNLFVELTEEYFQSSINTYESVITQYNKGIWSQFVNQRHFYQGFFQTLQTPIFAPLIGKSVYYQNVLQNYGAYYADLMPTSDRLGLEFEKNFTAGTINALTKQKLIDNYASLIIATSNSHFTYLPTASQEMANSQLPLTMYMQKMDFVSFSGDGKVLNSGGNKLLFLSGQTENSSNSLDKFKSDYNFVMQDLSGFTNYTIGILTLTPQDTSGEFSTFTPVTVNFDFMDDFAFTLFSDTILDSGKKQNFINIITNGIEAQNLTKCTQIINEVIDNYWYPQFTEEKNAEIDELNALKEEEFIKQKLSYNPQINGVSITTRDRIMSYSTIGNQSSYLSPFNNIKISQNTNSDPTSYNGKKQYNG